MPTKNAASKAASKKGAVKPKKASAPPISSAEPKAQRQTAQRPYPAKTLQEALTIPQAIRDKNNGNPWSTDDVAQAAIGGSKNTNKFFYTAAAARDYGLTVGTRNTEKIELGKLGREIVFAGDDATKRQKMIDAFFSIDIFKKVYEHYGSCKLPEKEYLENTLLGEFGLAKEFHDEFVAIFKANCTFLGIEDGVGSGVQISPRQNQTDAQNAEIRVVGEPKGKFDRTAFVIMPFVEKVTSRARRGFLMRS